MAVCDIDSLAVKSKRYSSLSRQGGFSAHFRVHISLSTVFRISLCLEKFSDDLATQMLWQIVAAFRSSTAAQLRSCAVIPASSIAEAAYAGSVIDTSDLTSKLTTGIKEKHPYRLEEMILEEVERTRAIHQLNDSCSLTALVVSKSHGLRQTQRFLSQGIHAAQSDRLFSSLRKRDVLQKARLSGNGSK